MSGNLAALAYLVAAVCFILALKGLSSPTSSRRGNMIGIIGMIIAVATTVADPTVISYTWIIGGLVLGGAIGVVIALKIQMTAMPQLVAAFHSLVGMAAVLVAASAYYAPEAYGILGEDGMIKTTSSIEMILGMAIGAITFSGSVIAFTKLQGLVSGAPVVFPGQHLLNLALGIVIVGAGAWFVTGQTEIAFLVVVALAFIIGITLIIPIGGADMPVVVSMLNSYSGWAAAGIGFTLENELLIITGALVGSSGAILSYIMCKAMNRSIWNVVFGGFGTDGGSPSAGGATIEGEVTITDIEEVAELARHAKSVMIVPGYGMAVARAQHLVNEFSSMLRSKGCNVRYAIHPVAGRLPGHMNVLLAEAGVPYDIVLEMDEINDDCPDTDLVLVIGANDVVNPGAETDESSPIYGMPVIQVWKAETTVVLKRSLGAGYAGVGNPLFYEENNKMLLGDAKDSMAQLMALLN